MARSICRRAERSLCRLLNDDENEKTAGGGASIYLNRLSDYLFTAGRVARINSGLPEQFYKS